VLAFTCMNDCPERAPADLVRGRVSARLCWAARGRCGGERTNRRCGGIDTRKLHGRSRQKGSGRRRFQDSLRGDHLRRGPPIPGGPVAAREQASENDSISRRVAVSVTGWPNLANLARVLFSQMLEIIYNWCSLYARHTVEKLGLTAILCQASHFIVFDWLPTSLKYLTKSANILSVATQEEEGTGVASDVVKVEGEDPDIPGYLRGDRVRLGRRLSRIVGASPLARSR